MGAGAAARLLLAAAGCIAALGCERPDPQAQAIGEARNTLSSVSAGGSASPPAKVLSDGFSAALSSAQRASDGGVEASRALGAAIASEAMAGQGGLAAAEYRRADAVLLESLNRAHAVMLLYSNQVALAAALSGYDPGEDVRRFSAAASEKERELAAARSALDENEEKVRRILARAEEKSLAGRSMRDAEAEVQARLLDAPTGERVALAERLHEMRRASQGVLKEAELLEAEAAMVAPRSVALRLEVERIEKQIAAFNEAAQRARDSARRRADESAGAEREARRVSVEARQAVDEARRILEESVRPAYDAARSKTEGALSRAGQARGGPGNQLHQISTGSAALSVASLRREFAESVGRVALALERAAGLSPPLEGSGELAAAAASLRAESESVMRSALEAYERAKSSLESGGSGDAGERARGLSVRIAQMRERLGGVPPEPPAQEFDHGTDSGDGFIEDPDHPADDGSAMSADLGPEFEGGPGPEDEDEDGPGAPADPERG